MNEKPHEMLEFFRLNIYNKAKITHTPWTAYPVNYDKKLCNY